MKIKVNPREVDVGDVHKVKEIDAHYFSSGKTHIGDKPKVKMKQVRGLWMGKPKVKMKKIKRKNKSTDKHLD